MVSQCSICLSNFKNPVCLPCGHLYCKKCLNEYVNAPGNTGMTANCPDCRTPFHLVVPDLGYLPQKYHPFISHAVRRVYLDTSNTQALEKKVKQLEVRVAQKTASEEQFMQRCEDLRHSLEAHRLGEREANDRIMELEEELEEKETGYQEHIKLLTAKCGLMEIEKNEYRDKYKNAKGRLAETHEKLLLTQGRVIVLRDELNEHQDMSMPREAIDDNPSDEESAGFPDPHMFRRKRQPTPINEDTSLIDRVTRPLPRRRLVRRPRPEMESPPPTFAEDRKRLRLNNSGVFIR